MATDAGTATFRAIADFSKVRREARNTKKELTELTELVGRTGARAGRMLWRGFVMGIAALTALTPLLGAIGAAALSSVANLLTLAQSLLTVAGAGLALPGIVGGFAVGIGVLISVLKDGADVLADLGPQFGALQDALSSSYWQQAAGPIRELVNDLMPRLHDLLGPIATGLGQMTSDLAKALGSALKGNVLDEMMGNTAESIQIARGAVEPLINGLVTLGQIGSEYLPKLASWFVRISESFEQFIATAAGNGDLNRWIDQGIRGLQDLGRIVMGVVGIFSALTQAANDAGATSTLGGLATGLERISAMMSGDSFQKAMVDIFRGAEAGAEGLLAALGPIGDAFAKGSESFADFLQLGGEIVGLIVGGLATALSNEDWGSGLISFLEDVKSGAETAVPLFEDLFAGLGDLLTVLGPLMEAFGPTLISAILLVSQALQSVLIALNPLLMAFASSPHAMAGLLIAFVAFKIALVGLHIYRIVTSLWSLVTAISGTTKVLVVNTASWIRNKLAMLGHKAATAGSWLLGMLGAIGRTTVALVLNTAAWVANNAQIVLAKAAAAGGWLLGILGTIGRTTVALGLNTVAWVANRIQMGLAKAAAAGGWLLGMLGAIGRTTVALGLQAGAWLASRTAMLAGAAATGIVTAAQWLLNAAMAANPITLIIIAIVALVAALIWFFTQTELGRAIVANVWNFIKSVIAGFVAWWTGTFWPAVSRVFTLFMAGLSVLGAFIARVWNSIRARASAVWGAILAFIASIPGRVIGFLMGLARLGMLAYQWFMGFLNSAKNVGASLLAWVAGLPGRILGMLGNLGSLLAGAGRSLIQGFIDGIQAMIGAVGDAVGGVMDFVSGFFPSSPAKRGAFSGKGWTPYRGKALLKGFSEGMKAGQPDLAWTAGDVMKSTSLALTPKLDPANLMRRPAEQVPEPAMASQPAPAVAERPQVNRSLNVEINNPEKEAPSQSIQKTYSKIAYLGLDAEGEDD